MGGVDLLVCQAAALAGTLSWRIELTLQAIIPYIPVKDPQLGRAVYEMVLGHLLVEDKPVSGLRSGSTDP